MKLLQTNLRKFTGYANSKIESLREILLDSKLDKFLIPRAEDGGNANLPQSF